MRVEAARRERARWIEATGYSRWFERLLVGLGIEVWIGNAAEIKAKRVRTSYSSSGCTIPLIILPSHNPNRFAT